MLRAATHIRSQSARLVCTSYRAAARPPAAVTANCYRYKSSSSSSETPAASSSSSTEPHKKAPAHSSKPSGPSEPSEKTIRLVHNEDLGRYLRDLAAHADAPDLLVTDPLTDPATVRVYPPTKDIPHESRVIIRNDPPLFEQYDQILEELGEEPEEVPTEEPPADGFEMLPLSARDRQKLHVYKLYNRKVVQQTGKGKIPRRAFLIVVGNGDGLVGMGHAKHEDFITGSQKSFIEAIRNMDYVERFENRTVWTELSTKFGSTRVILRPRPVGFGLRCNPYIHQILKAAGIKDCSAKVWGSRNPVNVIMATFRLLHAGNAPLAMGNGIGGGGKKSEKGSGMRSAGDIERERGRKLASLRTV